MKDLCDMVYYHLVGYQKYRQLLDRNRHPSPQSAFQAEAETEATRQTPGTPSRLQSRNQDPDIPEEVRCWYPSPQKHETPTLQDQKRL